MPRAIDATQFPFVAALTDDARQAVEGLRLAHAPASEQLLQRGERADGAFLVLSGWLRVYYVTPEGREATLYRVEPGGTCVLALTSTFADEPYPAWVQAGPEGGEYARVPSALFHRLMEREPAFRAFVFGALSGRIFELMQTLEEAGSARVEERVARFLLRRAHPLTGELQVTQIGIASELGTAREVVFRTLRGLAARGAIETGRKRIRVREPEALVRLIGEDPRSGSKARSE